MIGIQVFAGLCNRIFQIVFGYSYAKKHNTSFRLENWINTSHHSTNNYIWLINRFINTQYYNKLPVEYKYNVMEAEYRFTEYIEDYNNLDIHNNHYLIRGFFQNEKYFKEYRDDIIELLKEPEFITDLINTDIMLKDISTLLDEYYFIHIRLGDFVNCPKHWVNLENYYIKVIEKIRETNKNPNFILFSNGLEYLEHIYPKFKKYLIDNDINCRFINFKDEVVTFYLMLRCHKGGICGNSTFGWWPAWLNNNKNKEIYFPSRWMAIDDYNNNIDIYFEGSKIIEV